MTKERNNWKSRHRLWPDSIKTFIGRPSGKLELRSITNKVPYRKWKKHQKHCGNNHRNLMTKFRA